MHCSFKVLLILLFCYCICGDEIKTSNFKSRYRHMRHCKPRTDPPFFRRSILENPLYLIFLIFFGILLVLMLLGLIKGLIGLCSKIIGECGLGLLVDLPKPLDRYQERQLKDRSVVYDIGGWPVHPDTKERSVRVLPRRAEFCLNLVFFMAYPLALILQLCALCCCIRSYNENDESCFKSVNIIRCNEGVHGKDDKYGPGQKMDKYKDNDEKEHRDTSYVLNMMRQSQISLQRK